MKTKQAAIEAELTDKRYEKLKRDLIELEKNMKIKSMEDQRELILISDDAHAKELELINLLKKKQK
jgi:hypothetical protein